MFLIFEKKDISALFWGCHGRDRRVVGFTTTYAISAYHHWCCEFESRSGRGGQHYVIKFVCDLRQVSGFLRVHRFPPPIKLTATIYSTLKDILWWITFRDGRTAYHVWFGVDRCLLIAHLLCEYLIVAKLGVVNLYLKVIKLWLTCTCSCIYLITQYNFNSMNLDK